MSNQALTQFQAQQLPAAIQQLMGTMQSSELSQNVGANYAVVSIRGKVFRIKFGGVETPVMMTMPDGTQIASPYLDVVIPRANGALSKTWYKDSFSEGSNEQPDCWSEDGVNPLAPLDQRPINPATGAHVQDCRTCPMNQFGSKISPAGKPIKACADTRKVAVVPAINLRNDAFGGPMLLRVPAASLGGLAEFDRAMVAKGIPYFAVVVRIGFDQDPAYPKLTFTPLRVISNEDAAVVVELREDHRTLTVLGAQQANAPGGTAIPAPETAQAPVQPQAPGPQLAQQAFAQPVPQQAPQQAFAQPVQQTFQQPTAPAPQQAFNPGTGEIPGYVPQGPTAAQQAPQQAFVQPAATPAQAYPQPVAPAPTQAFQQPAAPVPQQAFVQPAAQAPAQPAAGPQGGAVPPADQGLINAVDNLLAL